MSAEVRPGYKLTEVGVIPEDWGIATISETMKLINGCAFKPSEWSKLGLPIIRIQNLNDAGADFNYFPGTIDERNRVVQGDLLFAWSGTLGSSFGARIWLGSEGVLNQHIFKVVPDQKRITKEYAYIVFARIEEDIAKKAHGFKSSFVHVRKSDLDSTHLPVPSIAEQQAIATALSGMDSLISSLDQLIAKKRDIKQAAMQQLLTGQRRLPGFSGGWKEKLLGECLLSSPDYGINAPAVPFSDYLPAYIRITDITDDNRFSSDSLVSVNSSAASDYYLDEGDIVFARTGASVGKSYLYRLSDGPLVFAGFLIRVKADQRILNPAFLAAYVSTDAYWHWVRVMSMRSGQPGINGNEYAQLPILLPSIEEQTAIATLLSDMDAEIAALEQRRDKAKLLKQGMMQELLSGRIRLL